MARKLDDPRQVSCPDLCRQAVRYASSSPAADLAGGPSEAQENTSFFSPLLMIIIIVYWYLFGNHYTRECIHTGERERNVASLNSPSGSILTPSSCCRHASYAHHLTSCHCPGRKSTGVQCPLQARAAALCSHTALESFKAAARSLAAVPALGACLPADAAFPDCRCAPSTP